MVKLGKWNNRKYITISALLVAGIIIFSNSSSLNINFMEPQIANAQGSITINNVQSTSGTTLSSITLSSFNVGTSNNRLLVVGVEASDASVNSITFGGTSLTKEVSSSTNNHAEFWYLVNPSGTGNIVVTMSAPTQIVVGAYALSGVDQTTPIPTSTTNHNTSVSSPTISITTVYQNSLVLDSPAIYGGSTLGSPTCTQEWNINRAGTEPPNQITGASSSKTQASPASVTCSWTASTGDFWDDVAIEVKASGTVPGAPTSLTATDVSSTQINLSWTAPSDNGGSTITGYKIERSPDGSTWSTIVSNTGNTSTSYTDNGLTHSTTYTYRVSAINSVGTGSPSNTASATTSAGIVLNGTKTTSGAISSSPYTITLSNFNVGSGSNRALVVGVEANNASVSSITFGGVQLTNKVSSFTNNDAEFWYLKNPNGTANIVVTMSAPTQIVVGAYSFFGIDQTNPLPTSATNHNSGNPAISLTTQYPGSLVLDSPAIYGGSTLGSPTCTQKWDTRVSSTTITGASSSTSPASPSAVTCSWTAGESGDGWDDAAVEVKESGSIQTQTRTGIMIPLYLDPVSDQTAWNDVVWAKGNHTRVPFVAIINPSNGPGNCPSQYINAINQLQSKGIVVLGYVWSGYAGDYDGHRSTDFTSAESDINKWSSCYSNINGIFLDGMSYDANNNNETGFYSQLTYDAKHLNSNFTLVVGNPGNPTKTWYIGTVDNIVIYESRQMPTPDPGELQNLTFYPNYDKKNFSMLPYDVSSVSNSTISGDSNYVRYMYITNLDGPPCNTCDPWSAISSHLMQIAGVLDTP